MNPSAPIWLWALLLAYVLIRAASFLLGPLPRWKRSIMPNAVRIGVIGDFEPAYHSHFATNAALYDAAAKLKRPLELRWLPTPALEGRSAERLLRRSDGLIASPGSPYKSFSGMLRGIEFARTRDWPFVGPW